MNTFSLRRTLILIMLCVILTGCNLALFNNAAEVEETEISPALRTLNAILTETASNSATPEPPTPTSSTTLLPTSTTTSTITPTDDFANQVQPATSCDAAGFIGDVTIPDGMEIEANTTFTKTWELRNDGTCTWNAEYDLVFYSGDLMNGEEAMPIGDDSVLPGETIQISIELTAPGEPGLYTGYWMLQNDTGMLFGISASQYAFYVEINVIEGQTTPTPTWTTTPTNTPEVTSPSSTTAAPTVNSTTTPTSTVTPTATPTATPETSAPTPTT